ncbi:hypothetical protein BP5796_11172 [Coleophoma crateriformis]|uniref:Rhodanese domain-containing protein n=1 Tax=Coleophoma crateriformis TaxID=565419 RepID=A0A3D8QMJ8_9HELO|nr:hypothetical protein BP5796_11172 [Coleophoma crateriformis]
MREYNNIGSSDPLSYECICSASDPNIAGLVLLFYRYFSNEPALPDEYLPATEDLETLSRWHTELAQKFKLGGKIRIAKEGFNITVGGTREDITGYIQMLLPHWTFSKLDLNTLEAQDKFFKPTPGCACVFPGGCNIRICSEITPMGVTNYTPKSWGSVVSLTPPEFHARCLSASENTLLLDVRNHYESRIGHFVSPVTGKAALMPPIRRFSQFPQYVKSHLDELDTGAEDGKTEILSYCTGGIRCEKGVRFLYDQLKPRAESPQVYTLHGGIAAYLTWVDEEIVAGRMSAGDCLFKGENYVFDARGSMGLEASNEREMVAECHACGRKENRMGKCASKGCHLVLVICEACEGKGVRCCPGCGALDANGEVVRKMCECEREREELLWAGRRKTPKQNGRNKAPGMDIQIKTID